MILSNITYIAIPTGALILAVLLIISLISAHNHSEKRTKEFQDELKKKDEARHQMELERLKREKEAAELKEEDLHILSRVLRKLNLDNSFEDCLKIYNLASSYDWDDDFPNFDHFLHISISKEELAELNREEAWERCVLYYKNQKQIENDLYEALKNEYPKCKNLHSAFKEIKYDIIAEYKKIPPTKRQIAISVKGWDSWMDIYEGINDEEE